MPAYSGTAGSVVLVNGGTSVVGEIREWAASFNADPVDVSNFGNSWREFIGGLKGADGSFNGQYDPSDADQAALLSAFENGSYVNLRLFVGTAYYFNVGSALINGHEPTTNIEGAATTTYNWTAHGSVGTASL